MTSAFTTAPEFSNVPGRQRISYRSTARHSSRDGPSPICSCFSRVFALLTMAKRKQQSRNRCRRATQSLAPAVEVPYLVLASQEVQRWFRSDPVQVDMRKNCPKLAREQAAERGQRAILPKKSDTTKRGAQTLARWRTARRNRHRPTATMAVKNHSNASTPRFTANSGRRLVSNPLSKTKANDGSGAVAAGWCVAGAHHGLMTGGNSVMNRMIRSAGIAMGPHLRTSSGSSAGVSRLE
jgi:hypothetical protein